MERTRQILYREIQSVTKANFELVALHIFQYQALYNPLYKNYLSLLHIDPTSIQSIDELPFLPISFFKTKVVQTRGNRQETKGSVFISSGTGRTIASRHFLRDLDFYKNNTVLGFQKFYGKVKNYCILGLLPSYLERSGSSLVAMVDHFIQLSEHPKSGFFLYNYEELAPILKECQKQKTPTLLIGVSFALLDFAEQYPLNLEDIIIMETGGMKGRRKEMTRAHLHKILKKAFNAKTIHSEYGMTELSSQAYSKADGIFSSAPTMKVLCREITDPLSPQKTGKTGALNIIDLANLDSCAFVATEDLGKVYGNGTFEILGRLDNSDIRGCNLMVN